ncbi:MAG: hypothetical protein ACD_51C00249G0011 [uncultured bacterium]|nr:MAG: hypothetical protein ACD_51C00249G0011 [uncultured bacterium]
MKKTPSVSAKFICSKCKSKDCETDEIQVVSGSAWSFQKGPHFQSVTCAKCKYTEFYKK